MCVCEILKSWLFDVELSVLYSRVNSFREQSVHFPVVRKRIGAVPSVTTSVEKMFSSSTACQPERYVTHSWPTLKIRKLFQCIDWADPSMLFSAPFCIHIKGDTGSWYTFYKNVCFWTYRECRKRYITFHPSKIETIKRKQIKTEILISLLAQKFRRRS